MDKNELKKAQPVILVSVGVLVCVIGYFLVWLKSGGVDFSGLDLATNKNGISGQLNNAWQIWIPLICLILAAISAIFAVIVSCVEVPRMYRGIVWAILGIIILVLVIVWETTSINGVDFGKDSWGSYLAIFTGVVIALTGIFEMTNLFEKYS